MLTRRGWALAAVAVGAVLLAAGFGARSLNAVVGPTLVALAAGWLQVRRAGRPDLAVEAPEYGFAGERATLSLDFAASTPMAATVRLSADDGIDLHESTFETTVADGSLPVDATLGERGFQSVGPVEVVVEDVLGVWEATHTYSASREIVVFPRIHRLDDVTDFAALSERFGVGGRDRFDQLREYERGDPLRNVHWKASAKRADDELVVMEFEADEERERVELLVEADGGRMDAAAEAAASVLTYLLDAGFAVGLTVPGDGVEPGVGPDHRTDLLTALARATPGTVAEHRRGDDDVVIQGRGGEDDVRVTIGERTVTFDQLSGSRDPGLDRDSVPAGDSASTGRGRSAVAGGERR
ncbi:MULTISPECIES: DUF58 domain-containing protein [Halorussus]|uniref:DUF58 domain-containing protein n=1 Tax=Halorussus TaxID=1070314 RepID=UPI000E2187C9|nr:MULTISPECIES: DUF58 domain-containing protein [Halorussus]NHN61136.1 DUF58 domain-containing protein [Halorussus sp. JP-T4]